MKRSAQLQSPVVVSALILMLMLMLPRPDEPGLGATTDRARTAERLSREALRTFRLEVALNLRVTATAGRLAVPLRFVRYRVRPRDDFFHIMARFSQNADTLASLNEIINPNALMPGTVILIPNARGLFVSGTAAGLARRHGASPDALVRVGGRWFIPGHRFSRVRLSYFLGRGFLPPLRGRITSRFGMRRDPFTNRRVFHGGLDIGARSGTRVHAARAGRVVRAGWAGGYGRLVVVRHRFGYETYYGHLSRILVRKGSFVKTGQLVGRVGSTGRSTGPHLHFEVRKNGRRKRPRFIHSVRRGPRIYARETASRRSARRYRRRR